MDKKKLKEVYDSIFDEVNNLVDQETDSFKRHLAAEIYRTEIDRITEYGTNHNFF